MNLRFLILFLSAVVNYSGPNFLTGLAPIRHTTLDMSLDPYLYGHSHFKTVWFLQQETNAMFLFMQLSNRIDMSISEL